MLAHNLKSILTIIPEAKELIKQANIEEEFPLDSRDSVIASNLRVQYLEKVANKHIDFHTKARVVKAAELYDVTGLVADLSANFNSLEKSASAFTPTRPEMEVDFESNLAGFGFLDLEKAASVAEELMETYGSEVESSEVRRYAGHAWLNKEAAVQAMSNRYHASKDSGYVKLAQLAAYSIREDDFESISALCKTVTGLDKKAGLDIQGFNFYKEALMTKRSELMSYLTVSIGGTQVPYEKVMKLGKDRLGSLIGKDAVAPMNDDPVNNKAILESLPADLQAVVKAAIRSI